MTDPDAPFDPLSRTFRPLGATYTARNITLHRQRMRAEAEFLAAHYQMDKTGKLPGDEGAQNLSMTKRRERIERLTTFPPIPPGELERLEGIIAAYGLPLTQLSSDTAAFVMRRVMLDFHRLAVLRREQRPGLFTREELIELMRVLKVRPAHLAQMVAGSSVSLDAAQGNIDRWLHDAARPTGTMAIRVNRLIEQNVRHPKRGGTPRPEKDLSTEKDTVRRRTQVRAAKERRAAVIPLAPSARRDADATT